MARGAGLEHATLVEQVCHQGACARRCPIRVDSACSTCNVRNHERVPSTRCVHPQDLSGDGNAFDAPVDVKVTSVGAKRNEDLWHPELGCGFGRKPTRRYSLCFVIGDL